MIAYRPLLRVEARCEFYGDARCRDLAFTPTQATAALVRNRGLLLRTTPAGLTVFCEADRLPADEAVAGEPLVFAFKVVAGDAGFENHTDLDSREMNTILVFDSDRAAIPGEGGTLRLHREAWATAADRIGVNAPELATVLDARDRLAPPLAVTIVRLSARDLAGSGGARSYYVAFRARRTLWKYYVLGAAETDATLSIRDADGAIEFNAARSSPERLPDNRQAVTLISNAPIALRERPAHHFQLRANSPGGERVLVRRLAVASPHQLGKETIDGREVTVSEIYINL